MSKTDKKRGVGGADLLANTNQRERVITKEMGKPITMGRRCMSRVVGDGDGKVRVSLNLHI